jgi:hypothetical protein
MLPLMPGRGGFLRPFGCGWFIREFLPGHGPEDSAVIDPEKGDCQADIFYHYKTALHRAYARDTADWENEERIRKGKPIYTPGEYTERVAWLLSRMPYKLFKCRFHSLSSISPTCKGWNGSNRQVSRNPQPFKTIIPGGRRAANSG